MRVRCTASGHPNNVGLIRYVSSITLDAGIANDVGVGVPTVKITFSEALPNHPNDGDTFVIEPPPVNDTAVPFEKWAYWLPWCPIEGRATTTTVTASAIASGIGGFAAFTVPAGHGIVAGQAVNVIAPAVPQARQRKPPTKARTSW